MPRTLRVGLLLACIVGAIWPFFNRLSIFAPPSVLEIVMFGELGAILYCFSDLPPYRPFAKRLANVVVFLLPVAIAMAFR